MIKPVVQNLLYAADGTGDVGGGGFIVTLSIPHTVSTKGNIGK